MNSLVIASISFLSMIITINAQSQCTCGNYIGVHCGERSTDGSNNLKGTCNPDIIYQCSAANIPATEKGYCSYCAKSEKAGTDYCAIGKAVNDRAGDCICGNVVGTHCGDRIEDGYLSINCLKNHWYRCLGEGLKAQDRGICNLCKREPEAGLDYCAATYGKYFKP